MTTHPMTRPAEVQAAREFIRKVAETVKEGNALDDPVADNGYTVEDALLHLFPFGPQLETGNAAALRAALVEARQVVAATVDEYCAYRPVLERIDAALAATSAPDAGWQDISMAPKDGREIETSAAGGLDVCHWVTFWDGSGEWSARYGNGEPLQWNTNPKPELNLRPAPASCSGMPHHVMDWFRQFPGEVVRVQVADNGNVRIWNRDAPSPSDDREQSVWSLDVERIANDAFSTIKSAHDLARFCRSIYRMAREHERQDADGAARWQPISEFPKDAEFGSSWEIVGVNVNGMDRRHLICRWLGEEGFGLPGHVGIQASHFRQPRPLPANDNTGAAREAG